MSEVHRGLMGTAWTVFTGDKPEPMQVEILGVLRGARGPGHDMILAQLHGTKPEYTGVVAGMSGSPVYIGNKLLGSLSYRIGQFSKDPIAGITPIGQMLEVRDLPMDAAHTLDQARNAHLSTSSDGMTFQAMETPLVMSGFRPEAIKLWQDKMAGTGLEMIAAGGSGSSLTTAEGVDGHISETALKSIVPGSAISAQLIRGDIEIAATCTVTYVDPKQLLACGHPILQAGPVSMPMTTTEVVATLASPLNAFKIVNTGETVGTFTQDRDAAIRGVLGEKAHMIPVHVSVHGPERTRKLNFEVLDLPSLTPQAVMVSIYNALLQTNESTADTSYHVMGSIALDGYPPSPLDLWIPGGTGIPASLAAALLTGESFAKLYSNGTRQGTVHSIDLKVDEIPRNLQVALESARVVSGDIVHAGDSIVIEATLRPWQEPARNVRIPIRIPDRFQSGNLRLLVSDAGTLDRTMDQPRLATRPADLETALAQARRLHPADQVYVSLLTPETQANMEGQTLSGLPLSMANALEPMHAAQDVTMNGESAIVAGHTEAHGVLTGFQVLNLHIEAGGGLD
ncbi:MAG TPA: SpoIVB peptidase S55 [Terracidiphilus sp.]|nr:SpoIVB peptidase S55 [Terracidiphilus sp.]